MGIQCIECGAIKIESVYHCIKCKKCVYKMDHHSPWINNCVGYINIKPFILWVFYTALLSLYGVFNIYQMAYRYELNYISLINFIPVGGMELDQNELNQLPTKTKNDEESVTNVTNKILQGKKSSLFSSSPLGSVRSLFDFLTFSGVLVIFVYCI